MKLGVMAERSAGGGYLFGNRINKSISRLSDQLLSGGIGRSWPMCSLLLSVHL